MSELTIIEQIREWIGDLGFRVFLWSRGWTAELFIALVRGER